MGLARSFGTGPPTRFRFAGEFFTPVGRLARLLLEAANSPA